MRQRLTALTLGVALAGSLLGLAAQPASAATAWTGVSWSAPAPQPTATSTPAPSSSTAYADGYSRLLPGTAQQPKQRLAVQQDVQGASTVNTTVLLTRGGTTMLRWTMAGANARLVKYGYGKPGDVIKVQVQADKVHLTYSLDVLADGRLAHNAVGASSDNLRKYMRDGNSWYLVG